MSFPRCVGSLVFAAAVAMSPTTAVAGEYGGDEERVVVTDTNPEPGDPVEVVVDAGTGADNDEVTLTITSQDPGVPDSAIDIAGSQSMTKSTVAGKARFTVTLHVEDAYSLVGRDEFGNVISRVTLVVGDGTRAGGGGSDGSVGGSAGGTTGAGLGATGASVTTTALGLGGGALVLAGGALLMTRRRRIATTA